MLSQHPEASIEPDDVEQTGTSARTEIPIDDLQERETPREEPAPDEWITADDED
jgi:hypothetical protein